MSKPELKAKPKAKSKMEFWTPTEKEKDDMRNVIDQAKIQDISKKVWDKDRKRYVSKDPENAKINYHKIPKEQLTEQITAKYIHITTGDTSALKKYDEKRKKKQIAKEVLK